MTEQRCGQGTVVTFGEALAVLVPTEPQPIEEVQDLRLYVGGAEVNFAIGVSRLGLNATFIGKVGDDALGRRIRANLEHEGVSTDHLGQSSHPTGLYLREWLADGLRRPYYYRSGSAAAHFAPEEWPDAIKDAVWLHLTGITPALSDSCRHATEEALRWAKSQQIPVSFDINYRPALWDLESAARALQPIAEAADLLLAGHQEAHLLFGTDDPEQLANLLAMHDGRPERTVVVKSGSQGATAWHRGRLHHQPAESVEAVDPVGAGDAFDAAFIASRLVGRSIGDAMALAAHCAAKVVGQPGEHVGFPVGPLRLLRDDLPRPGQLRARWEPGLAGRGHHRLGGLAETRADCDADGL